MVEAEDALEEHTLLLQHTLLLATGSTGTGFGFGEGSAAPRYGSPACPTHVALDASAAVFSSIAGATTLHAAPGRPDTDTPAADCPPRASHWHRHRHRHGYCSARACAAQVYAQYDDAGAGAGAGAGASSSAASMLVSSRDVNGAVDIVSFLATIAKSQRASSDAYDATMGVLGARRRKQKPHLALDANDAAALCALGAYNVHNMRPSTSGETKE